MTLILGVTGAGKGRLAFDLADRITAEIISIDSMKVYRRMDIGTAKPPKEARNRVKYHLIDVVEPSEPFGVGTFLDLAYEAIEQIENRNNPVVAVGGTAMYIKALLYGLFEGPCSDEQIRAELFSQANEKGLEQLYRRLKQLDPESAERIHPNDMKRIIRALEVYKITGKPISSLQQQWNDDAGKKRDVPREMQNTRHKWSIIGLRREKAEESKRINARVKKMIEQGLVEEVENLLAEEKPLSKQARCAIGYAEIIDHLEGKTTLDEAVELIKIHTRRLAKHQRTWFKTFKNINWLDIEQGQSAETTFARAKVLLNRI